jgi:hypothetical protein
MTIDRRSLTAEERDREADDRDTATPRRTGATLRRRDATWRVDLKGDRARVRQQVMLLEPIEHRPPQIARSRPDL